MKIVKNLNILKGMQNRGLITLHNQTGSKIEGLYSNQKFTCYYIADGLSNFDYKGKKYSTRYFSGCFCPYVVENYF